jgi:hypothetical protein
MMLEPVNTLEDGIAPRQRCFKLNRMARQSAALIVNTRLKGAMPGGQFQ